MRVPISMNGKQSWYQLDTGADEVVLYGTKKEEGWITKGDATRIPNVQFAGMSISAILAYRMPNLPDEGLQGTVGLDLLVGHTFVIDFPKQRVCLMNRADVPESLMKAASWTPALISDGKLFLDAELNGKKVKRLMYDTGTSPDDLLVDFDLWKEATGKTGSKDATMHEMAQSWGQPREFIGAVATGDLKLGEHIYRHPQIRTAPSKPNDFRENYFGAQGALGNALFLNSIVILDLGAHPEFGVVPPKQ